MDFLPFGKQQDRVAFALTAPPEDFDSRLMGELIEQLKGARRMSITYRFEKNSGELELKAKQDIPRLARFLKSAPMRGKQILLLGFADASGPFGVNMSVALARAASVRAALLAADREAIDPKRVTVKAYGELMPVDCNTTEDGQATNRRVEVWVKGWRHGHISCERHALRAAP